MAYDFKKEQKEFYAPKAEPEIVLVPEMHYVAVRGSGDPNAEGGAYQKAVSILYAVSYTLKMSKKAGHTPQGFFDYVVPPLEGFWQQDQAKDIDYLHKEAFRWISMIRLPDFITKEDFRWAVNEAERKKKMDCSPVEFLTVDEGLCVQMMHIGPYDNEPSTIAAMNAFLQESGYENDLSDSRLHHEIYLTDPRRTVPEKWRTIIRHPVRKA